MKRRRGTHLNLNLKKREASGRNKRIPRVSTAPNPAWVWRMSRLTQDGTAEPVSWDQILGRQRGQGKYFFLCSADHKRDWQPYPVDVQSAGESDGDTCILFYFFFFSSSLISLIADGPHHYHPACGHKGSSHLSLVHAFHFFLSRCKFSTLTTRQPKVEFYIQLKGF